MNTYEEGGGAVARVVRLCLAGLGGGNCAWARESEYSTCITADAGICIPLLLQSIEAENHLMPLNLGLFSDLSPGADSASTGYRQLTLMSKAKSGN